MAGRDDAERSHALLETDLACSQASHVVFPSFPKGRTLLHLLWKYLVRCLETYVSVLDLAGNKHNQSPHKAPGESLTSASAGSSHLCQQVESHFVSLITVSNQYLVETDYFILKIQEHLLSKEHNLVRHYAH